MSQPAPFWLAAVRGALAPPPASPPATDDFGRCGPGTSWTWLGNVYTPECAAHDLAVRSAEADGGSHVLAELHALPLLPAAIGSYFRARFAGH